MSSAQSSPAGAVRRLSMVIAYDGTNYCGWQRQNNGISIQGEIETRLARMTTEEIFVHGAGRTDAGVHAKGMVAHFDTGCKIASADFHRGLNSLLPPDIRIYRVEEVSPDFHARFSASGKRYCYTIFTGPILPPLSRFSHLHFPQPLSLQAVEQCLQLSLGTHDFSAFENVGTRDRSKTHGRGAVRTLFVAKLTRDENLLRLTFVGDGFLKNMVRNLVGTILEVGRGGKINVVDYQRLLAGGDRSRGGPTVPPQGLCLEEVYYSPLRGAP